METYYGVIYFKDGRKYETGNCSGAGAEQMCERLTAQQFEQFKKTAVSDFFMPTRFEVKVRKN